MIEELDDVQGIRLEAKERFLDCYVVAVIYIAACGGKLPTTEVVTAVVY